MTNEVESPPRAASVTQPWSRIVLAAGGFALLVGFAAMLSGLGTRWGLWHFRTGFSILRWAAYGGILAALLALVAIYWTRPGTDRKGLPVALGALVVALLAFGIPWQASRAASRVPPIHDITTDTEDPPRFVAIAPLRADAPNPVEYPGEEVARQQRQAYPDIRPVILDLPMDRAFQRALDGAEARGWQIVEANAAEGRIEATDRTFWFGFRDDVVIRLSPLNGRTVVDVRSKSRVGMSDVGTNARRIRDYLNAITD